MKRLLILVSLLYIVGYSYSQSTMKLVNVKTDTVIKKETVSNLTTQVVEKDSIVKVQQDSIVKQSEEIKVVNKEARDKYLWGGADPMSYFWGMIFALIGILINTVIITQKAIKKDPNSPETFSLSYWWSNNKDRVLRWIGVLAVIFVSMRFCNEIFHEDLTMFFAFTLGLGLDYVIEVLKKIKPKSISDNQQ